MKILRITPFPPDYIGGLPLYCKNISLNLAKLKDVETDILTPDLLNKNMKFEYINQSIRVIYKRSYSVLWDKNPIVNIGEIFCQRRKLNPRQLLRRRRRLDSQCAGL